MHKLILTLAVLANLTATTVSLKAGMYDDPLSADEKALVDKGLIMELYDPSQHSSHEIVHIDAIYKKGTKPHSVPNPQPLVCFVFGMEDAAVAREEGRNMAAFDYTPQMAQQFLFAEGWDKYKSRYFTRAYVQEGMDAFNGARRKH
jgi:hypothetical protein